MVSIKKVKVNLDQTVIIANLIGRTFCRYNLKDATKEGAKMFLDRLDVKKKSPAVLADHWQRLPIFLVAFFDSKICGVAIGQKNRIVSFFVDGRYHRLGIGSKLLNGFEKESFNLGGRLVKIRASRYALNFYQKNGYLKTTGLRNFRGLSIQPMQKRLRLVKISKI